MPRTKFIPERSIYGSDPNGENLARFRVAGDSTAIRDSLARGNRVSAGDAIFDGIQITNLEVPIMENTTKIE